MQESLKLSAHMQNHVFNLRPSKIYAFLISLIIITSMLIWVCLPISLTLKIAGLIVLPGYGIYLLRNRQLISAIKYNGEWSIARGKVMIEASLQGDSTVTAYVLILRFRVPGKKWPISSVIFRDALPGDQYRQLLVVLRMS